MSLFDRLVRLFLPLVPQSLVGRVARRYIAGPTLEDAVRTVRQLNAEGARATVDFLGEEVRAPAEVERAVDEYQRALVAVREQQLDCNLSLKPTLFGLRIGEDLCREAIGRLTASAAASEVFVRLDMEDHTTTDATLRIFEATRKRYGNVGVALQSMLRRTVADIGRLAPTAPNVRLCKGIYREPRAIAWRDRETNRASFAYALDKLLGSGCFVGIATHDEHLVFTALSLIDRLGLPPERYEFQMLLGVDPELRRIILGAGHRLRVYVPYGDDWYGYSLRRLRENPTIAGQVLKAMLRRGRDQ